ncbi:hypothetical protein K402DRAFT_456857 [Aulographum hederae CBS 113979]|uniref:Uncharacterized protein n=1 Tax=Aulographum hederae CBS 113979 TaxID=1176131 RepID=A0A6G1GQ16_9PEZI|nr:hypothetical protein K402DRAFT_456857 [Aulographum hederae CBS 113979]
MSSPPRSRKSSSTSSTSSDSLDEIQELDPTALTPYGEILDSLHSDQRTSKIFADFDSSILMDNEASKRPPRGKVERAGESEEGPRTLVERVRDLSSMTLKEKKEWKAAMEASRKSALTQEEFEKAWAEGIDKLSKLAEKFTEQLERLESLNTIFRADLPMPASAEAALFMQDAEKHIADAKEVAKFVISEAYEQEHLQLLIEMAFGQRFFGEKADWAELEGANKDEANEIRLYMLRKSVRESEELVADFEEVLKDGREKKANLLAQEKHKEQRQKEIEECGNDKSFQESLAAVKLEDNEEVKAAWEKKARAQFSVTFEAMDMLHKAGHAKLTNMLDMLKELDGEEGKRIFDECIKCGNAEHCAASERGEEGKEKAGVEEPISDSEEASVFEHLKNIFAEGMKDVEQASISLLQVLTPPVQLVKKQS